MIFPRRISTIYRKELVDILRDRRTLIAMIVVPIVLYPLLMLGSVQAVSYQSESLREEELILGIIDSGDKKSLIDLITADAAALARERAELDLETEATGELPTALDTAKLLVFDSAEALEEAIRNRQLHAGIIFASDVLIDAVDQQNKLRLLVDREEVRSGSAGARLVAMMERIADRTVRQRLAHAHLPETFVQPFVIETVNLSAPPSILGQILPLILVLMTITGAIYPAIDLTAGERERGTLETLMVCPVPVIDLIVGKFLVVTTIAILGAALNLTSVSATVYFGGFDKVIASSGGSVPVGKMIFILLALIPFAVLMSAIMIAVSSYARSFKEAQNYVTPIILAVLIPGGIAALPATRLEGIMLVIPVANMVLLARDVLLGAAVPLFAIALVLLSTTLYATAAVAVAASVFGKESVVFADTGSLRATFSRRLMKPESQPPVSMAMLIVALLFPAWFFVQSLLSADPEAGSSGLLRGTAIWMPLLFVLIPAGVLAYWKVNLRLSLCLRWPETRYLLAAVLIGMSAWVPAHELYVAQQTFMPIPQAVSKSMVEMQETVRGFHPAMALLILALIPAVCEELLFRGVFLAGLRTALSSRSAILVSAAVFGVFHFALFKFMPTAALGIVLAYLCWRSRSILPCVTMHLVHNALAVSAVFWPWQEKIGIPPDDTMGHLPTYVLLAGGALLIVGLLLTIRTVQSQPQQDLPALADTSR